MFGNNRSKAVLGPLAMVLSISASADDLVLEPCIDGAVSPSGTHPTAALERQANGYQTWSNYAPYYLFAVSATYLESPFDEEAEGPADAATTN